MFWFSPTRVPTPGTTDLPLRCGHMFGRGGFAGFEGVPPDVPEFAASQCPGGIDHIRPNDPSSWTELWRNLQKLRFQRHKGSSSKTNTGRWHIAALFSQINLAFQLSVCYSKIIENALLGLNFAVFQLSGHVGSFKNCCTCSARKTASACRTPCHFKQVCLSTRPLAGLQLERSKSVNTDFPKGTFTNWIRSIASFNRIIFQVKI